LIDETRRVNTPKPGVRLGILIKGRRSPPFEVCPVARLFSLQIPRKAIMELKCTCNQCNQSLSFPAEMVGQTIACPHCQMDTFLFNPPPPPQPAMPKPPTPKLAAKPETQKSVTVAFPIEDNLESIADTFYGFGLIGGVLVGIAALLTITNGDWLPPVILGATAISLYAQGVIIRILFYAASKALRLLTVIATQSLKP
jgi:hypothetical protein